MNIEYFTKLFILISSLSSILPMMADSLKAYQEEFGYTSFVIRNDTCVIIDELRADSNIDMSAIASTCKMRALPSANDISKYYSLFSSIYPQSFAFWNVDIDYIEQASTLPHDTITVTLRFPNLKGTNIVTSNGNDFFLIKDGKISYKERYNQYHDTNNIGLTINPIFEMSDCTMGIFKGMSYYFFPALYKLQRGFDMTVTLPNVTDELLRYYFLCDEVIYITDNKLFWMGDEYTQLSPDDAKKYEKYLNPANWPLKYPAEQGINTNVYTK